MKELHVGTLQSTCPSTTQSLHLLAEHLKHLCQCKPKWAKPNTLAYYSRDSGTKDWVEGKPITHGKNGETLKAINCRGK